MRRKLKSRRVLIPDVKYGSVLVTKLIKRVMQEGKESKARTIVYGALEAAEKKIGKPALGIFEQVIENAAPLLELKSRRVGGANYQIPYPVQGERRTTLAIRWMVAVARKKKGKGMQEKL